MAFVVMSSGLLWGDVGPSQADQIRLHDGSVRAGTIVAESPTHIVIEIKSRGIASLQSIARSAIAEVVEAPVIPFVPRVRPGPAELARRQEAAVLDGTGPAFYELGVWSADNGWDEAAIPAFETAAQLDASLAADARFRTARSLVAIDEVGRAKQVLIKLVRANPDHHAAARELGMLEVDRAERLTRRVGLAVERFRKGEHAQSILTLVGLAAAKDAAHVAQVERRVRSLTGLSIAELIVENRFSAGCTTCRKEKDLRDGLVNCPTCKGRGRVYGANESAGGMPGGMGTSSTVDLCRTCRGFTYILCPTCNGAALQFGDVGTVERDAMVARLWTEIEQAWEGDLQPLLAGQRPLIAPLVEDSLLACRKLSYLLDALASLGDRIDAARRVEIERRREVLDRVLVPAEALYAERSLAVFEAGDRTQLERVLLNEDSLIREIVGEITPPPAGTPGPPPRQTHD